MKSLDVWGEFFGMIFTETATRVKELVKEQNESTDTADSVVEGGGCHGFQYGFGFEQDIADDDSIYETNGVRLVVDSASIMYLNDAKVDYVSASGDRFVIDNGSNYLWMWFEFFSLMTKRKLWK